MDELNQNDESEEIKNDSNDVVEDTIQDGIEDTVEIKEKKNNILKIILGCVAGVVIVGAIVIFTILLFSNKFAYFKLLGNSFDNLTDTISQFNNSVFGKILNTDTNKKLTIDTEVSANIETTDKELLAWLNGLKTVKLIAKENTDLKNNYFDSNINISVNDENVILADLLRKNNIFSAKIDGITDQYISADNNGLSTLWQKVGYEGPDKFTSQLETLQNFKLSKSEVNTLKSSAKRIGKAFTTAFTDDDFSRGEGTITYNDKALNAKYIDFKMNSFEMNNGVIAALEQLLKEDKAIDVLLKLSNSYDEMYNQIGYQIEPLTREELVETLKYILEQIKTLEFSSEEGMTIRLYYKGSKVIKAEMLTLNLSNSIMKLVMIDDGKEKYYEYSNGVESYIDKVSMASKGIWTHEINTNFINQETGEFIKEYGDKFIMTVDNSKKNYSKIIASSESGTSDYTLIGNILDNKKTLSFNMLYSDDAVTNDLLIRFNMQEKSAFEEKVLDATQTFDTTKATDEEIVAKKESIVNNLGEFYNKNSNKLKQLNTAMAIYLGSFVPQNNGTFDMGSTTVAE